MTKKFITSLMFVSLCIGAYVFGRTIYAAIHHVFPAELVTIIVMMLVAWIFYAIWKSED